MENARKEWVRKYSLLKSEHENGRIQEVTMFMSNAQSSPLENLCVCPTKRMTPTHPFLLTWRTMKLCLKFSLLVLHLFFF